MGREPDPIGGRAVGLDPSRPRPVVLVAQGAIGRPVADAEAISAAVDHVADVYELSSGPLSYAFTKALDPSVACYGGACRIYPSGTDATGSPRCLPFHTVFTAADATRATAALIEEALGAAYVDGYTTSSDGRPAPTRSYTPRAARVEPAKRHKRATSAASAPRSPPNCSASR